MPFSLETPPALIDKKSWKKDLWSRSGTRHQPRRLKWARLGTHKVPWFPSLDPPMPRTPRRGTSLQSLLSLVLQSPICQVQAFRALLLPCREPSPHLDRGGKKDKISDRVLLGPTVKEGQPAHLPSSENSPSHPGPRQGRGTPFHVAGVGPGTLPSDLTETAYAVGRLAYHPSFQIWSWILRKYVHI